MRIRHAAPALLGTLALSATVLASTAGPADADPVGRGALPPMGWNSWNSGIPLTEKTIHDTVDALVSSGMRDAGYRYVNLDAGWAAAERDADGNPTADPARFPSGIAALAHYVHDHGMSLGLYSSPYNETCGQTPGNAGLGHETQDARTFAAWGVDYLKYDWCHGPADHDEQLRVFGAMRDALRDSGRHIVYSINPNSSDDIHAGTEYDWTAVADLTRNTGDLIPIWSNPLPEFAAGPVDSRGFVGITDQLVASATARPSRPGYSADPDMLVVGVSSAEFMGAHANLFPEMATKTGALPPDQAAEIGHALQLPDQVRTALRAQRSLTPDEERAHFSLWALLSAPLIAGNDVRTMDASTRATLTNRAVVAVDQDPLVAPVTTVGGDHRILVKRLADGGIAVALFNSGDTPVDLTTTTAAAGLGGHSRYLVRDLWAGTITEGAGRIAATVPAHGVTLLRVSAQRN